MSHHVERSHLRVVPSLNEEHLDVWPMFNYAQTWPEGMRDKDEPLSTDDIAQIVQAAGHEPIIVEREFGPLEPNRDGEQADAHRLFGRQTLHGSSELQIRGSDLKILLSVTNTHSATRNARVVPYRHSRESIVSGSIEGAALTGLCAYIHKQSLLRGEQIAATDYSRWLRLMVDVPDTHTGLLDEKFVGLSQQEGNSVAIENIGVVSSLSYKDNSRHLLVRTKRYDFHDLPKLVSRQVYALGSILRNHKLASAALSEVYGGDTSSVVLVWQDAMRQKSAVDAGLETVRLLQGAGYEGIGFTRHPSVD